MDSARRARVRRRRKRRRATHASERAIERVDASDRVFVAHECGGDRGGDGALVLVCESRGLFFACGGGNDRTAGFARDAARPTL